MKSWSSRCPLILLPIVAVAALSIFPAHSQVFTKTSEIPRTSKTPQSIALRQSGESERLFTVRASLAEIRLSNSSSRGSAGMTGRLNKFRKFVRIDLRAVPPYSQLDRIEVKYVIKEGDHQGTLEESLSVKGATATNFTVDMKGFEDTSGSKVTTRTSGSTITSTKTKHAKSDIVGVEVTVSDTKGKIVYAGAWPNPSKTVVQIPARLKPRVFTSNDGRKVQGTITALNQDKVTLLINGRPFVLPLNSLSEEDQTFLNNLLKPTLPVFR